MQGYINVREHQCGSASMYEPRGIGVHIRIRLGSIVCASQKEHLQRTSNANIQVETAVEK